MPKTLDPILDPGPEAPILSRPGGTVWQVMAMYKWFKVQDRVDWDKCDHAWYDHNYTPKSI